MEQEDIFRHLWNAPNKCTVPNKCNPGNPRNFQKKMRRCQLEGYFWCMSNNSSVSSDGSMTDLDRAQRPLQRATRLTQLHHLLPQPRLGGHVGPGLLQGRLQAAHLLLRRPRAPRTLLLWQYFVNHIFCISYILYIKILYITYFVYHIFCITCILYVMYFVYQVFCISYILYINFVSHIMRYFFLFFRM